VKQLLEPEPSKPLPPNNFEAIEITIPPVELESSARTAKDVRRPRTV
jgi:hypothetical protein